MRRTIAAIAASLAVAVGLSGCAGPALQAGFAELPPRTMVGSVEPGPEPTTTPIPTATPSPTATKPKPKPTATKATTGSSGGGTASDGVPAIGNGTFTVAPGGSPVIGTGTTLVTYRIEVENGITWGANQVWTPDSFAATAESILADPRGWIASAKAPVTDAAQHMNQASWSFQRVSDGSYSVRVLLATPGTVDKMCGSIGLKTNGQYSCRYGQIILINLRRWLKGAPGFPMDLTGYHTMVINHEMGHRLGFKHMLCGTPGTLAPVMSEETIDIGGCLPNAYPFAPDGTFISGPWTA